jgi:hypothetical protein
MGLKSTPLRWFLAAVNTLNKGNLNLNLNKFGSHARCYSYTYNTWCPEPSFTEKLLPNEFQVRIW